MSLCFCNKRTLICHHHQLCLPKMIKDLFENIVSSGIEDRASPILTRIRLLNLFLLAAAIGMTITLV